MPVSILIEDEGRTARLEAYGFVSGEELVEANRSFLENRLEALRLCRRWLSDYTEADLESVATPDVQQLAQISLAASRENPHLAVAIVVGADFPFGLARMWEAFSEETGWRSRVFRSIPEARIWLEEVAPFD